MRDLFEQAKKNVSCIIFIDEIDTVSRDSMAIQALLQLLRPIEQMFLMRLFSVLGVLIGVCDSRSSG